jgi:hypothetical protein
MLMTRLVYLSVMLIILAVNGAALWAMLNGTHEVDAIVPAALIFNIVTWPLALVVAYRIGQVTGVEYFRQIRAKMAAARASRRTAPTRR